MREFNHGSRFTTLRKLNLLVRKEW